jgi:hypothetical protein
VPVGPAVGRDEREQRRPERDEQVRAQPRLPLPQLPFDADRRPEAGR